MFRDLKSLYRVAIISYLFLCKGANGNEAQNRTGRMGVYLLHIRKQLRVHFIERKQSA